MLGTSDAYLTEDELDELEQFLFSESGLAEPMNLSEIDGLLTSVVIGPVFPPPSQWMPLIWGDDEGPEFASQAQAERIIGLLMQHMNSLSKQFRENANDFEPMLTVTLDEDKKPVTVADHWCMGFLAGVDLTHGAWSELDELALMPILMFASEPGNTDVDNELESNRDYWIEQLTACVISLYKHWSAQSTDEAAMNTVIRPGPKVGRNDPCPCGSGKKFKHCCLH